MSLFFFHVRNGSTTLDRDGVEFPDVEAARREAIVACGELLRDVPVGVLKGASVRLWVKSEHLAGCWIAFRSYATLPSRKSRRGTAAEKLNTGRIALPLFVTPRSAKA